MPNFEEMLQTYVNTDYEVLVSIAAQAAEDLLPVCALLDSENKGVMLLSCIVLSAVGADGQLTDAEYRFLSDVLKLDTDLLHHYVKMYDADMEKIVDNFADNMNVATKTDIISLICAVSACDETISRTETSFISRILEC